MLYVFHVDVGRMLNFDMTVALSSVENLKATIERLHGIPASNIVLLVSGGEMLIHTTQVSYYSAGTDTNPIYMFLTGEIKLPPLLAPMEADSVIREQVERSLDLPAVYDTVVKRAQIALRMYDLARDEDRMCERLVHEQHLQQQGWSAVVANMEDLTEEFRSRFLNFCEAFDRHLYRRCSYLELLKNFSDDLNKLSRIPILPGLMTLAEADFHGFDEYLENDDVFSKSTNQEQSVILVGANVVAATATETDNENANANASAVITDSGGADNTEDKSTSSTTTSPNKKLKMAIESNGDRSSQTSQNSTTSNTARRLNLLQWITSKENHNALRTMSEECIQGLATFNADVYEKLKQEVQNIIKLAEQSDVKEIRGLGERLCKLEEFKYKIKSMVKDQKELSTAFQQNQNRAINLRDTSILPDLCASHQSQLLVMLQNHRKIREHRHCIAKAKDELGGNLHARLKRIVYIENAMSEFDNRLLFYHRCLRRAERHLHIIEQIHQAPNMYMAAVTEVMRRKIFSTEFRLWASKLAEDFDSIHSEEMKRREQFNINFEGHFLNILFPGMADMPPAFANENPLIFDARLPNITRSDIDILTTHLPEMVTQIQLPNMEPVIYFFVSRSGAHQRERFEELLKQKDKLAAKVFEQISGDDELPSSCTKAMEVSETKPLNPRLCELRKDVSGTTEGGEESETDTETEFEKVPSNSQRSVSTSTSLNFEHVSTITKSTATDQLITQTAETLTDETSETIKKEVTHMRVMLGAMSKLALECIQLARSNLQIFRKESIIQKGDLESDLQALNDKWNVLKMQCETREQELSLQRDEREQKILELSQQLKQRDYELKREKEFNREISTMKIICATLEDQVDDLKDKLKSLETEKDQALLELREKLMHEHKTEIESLRQRFKLMTSMDRTPSDLSLETNPLNENHIEKQLHDTILSQQRSEMEAEKEKAITTAIQMERSIWQSKIFPLNSESVMANVSILKEMLEDKERLLDQLREKDLMVTKENFQLKTRLDALTNEEGNSWLKEKIDYLNKDKCRLEEELNMEKSRRLEMETSVAHLKCPTYDQTALTRSKSSGSSHKLLVLESCSKGDIVLIVWSMLHGQFIVIQDSPSLYFVHGDSLSSMNLRLPHNVDENTIPIPYYAFGRVVEKEYCQARKDENRYRVSKGSKFYRIKVTPLLSRQSLRRDRVEFFYSTSFSIEVMKAFSTAPRTAVSGGTSQLPSAITSTSLAIGGSIKDVVDAAVTTTTMTLATSPITIITSTAKQATLVTPSAAMLAFKERNFSITSVAEEDDESVSLQSERCRYISVSEEDENDLNAVTNASENMDITATATKIKIVQPQQTTVITEQPTATDSKLALDLMLASADINATTAAEITESTLEDSENFERATTPTATATDTAPQIIVSTSQSQIQNSTAAILVLSNQEINDKSSPPIPISIGTTSEDSDEYRSLEPKDETDFPISE